MDVSDQFEVVGPYAVFRPAGEVTLEQASTLIAAALELARNRKIRKLVINSTALNGFQSPGVVTRYHMVHDWAKSAGGAVQVAMVARPEMIDPSKFGVTVAQNIGFVTNVFVSEEEAIAWLLAEK